jgi:hypothetical protein
MTLLERYAKVSSHIIIPSKDYGLIKYVPFGTQRYLREQIIQGVEDGIHDFSVLKPRQVGASTEMWSFDLFWLIYHPGLQGAFIAQDEKALIYGIDNLRQMQRSIPARFTPTLRVDNRNLLAWYKTFDGKHGGSRLIYLHAGKGGGGLGRSRGLSFGHFTEVAFWSDPDDIDALRASLSRKHPRRCFVWESTANGYNWWRDMCMTAKKAVTQRFIFVPWWRHELYRAEPDSRIYQVYWDGRLTSDEKSWAKIIKKTWDVVLDPAQWAWYRWELAEEMRGNEIMMHQEFPTLPEHAFQASGKSFLGVSTIVKLREAVAGGEEAEYYRYEFGRMLEDTKIVPTGLKMAHLKVWEKPRNNTFYVISGDPAFAANPDSDNAVITVWRSERDGMVQVAEFAATDIGPKYFAWIIAHLCGTYPIAHLILEVNGPGMAVLEELQQLERWGHGSTRYAEINNVLGGIRHFIYRRPDSLGAGGFYHWKTTGSNRPWLFSRFRDNLNRGAIVVRSDELVEELNEVRQDGEDYRAPSHAHDDRVISAALAAECWSTNVEPMMAFMPVVEEGKNTGDIPDLSKVPVPEMHQLPGIADFFSRLKYPESV